MRGAKREEAEAVCSCLLSYRLTRSLLTLPPTLLALLQLRRRPPSPSLMLPLRLRLRVPPSLTLGLRDALAIAPLQPNAFSLSSNSSASEFS